MVSSESKLVNNKAYILAIDEESALQRLDNFLFNRLKNVPKSRIYRMLRSGEVRVNKKRVKPLYKLQPNDLIRIPPFWAEEVPVRKPGADLVKLLLNSIVFEDSEIIVINKPSGIASHSGSGIDFGVIEILRAARSDLKTLELVHRLDRDTSGCLILAKKRTALRQLHQLALDGKISKKYILLVKGVWSGGERIVDAPLLKNQLQSGERMVMVDEEGKKSITIFRPIKIGKEVSLLEAELKTGRTHQIRVHAAHIGHPIAGDQKYTDAEFNNKMKKIGIKRLFLHSKKISFCWENGEEVSFSAELDNELKDILVRLL
ncbi:MAG: RluA family pseudouridine synthase [Gammaproteobacteria bacterium]|nr:RluA family pseudouridine synthase [Gammaproteobacteria bacterium]